jgi:hypothetical protein
LLEENGEIYWQTSSRISRFVRKSNSEIIMEIGTDCKDRYKSSFIVATMFYVCLYLCMFVCMYVYLFAHVVLGAWVELIKSLNFESWILVFFRSVSNENVDIEFSAHDTLLDINTNIHKYKHT